ncbi:MAG: DMT family transporter [Alphaproteobacteria bacterium]|nr:DMT family transporter [Alphaproteobacteria bacterium]
MKPFAPRDVAALVLIAVIWGINNLAAKYAVEHVPPLLVAAIRFAVVSAALVVFLKPVANWRALAVIAILSGPLHFGIQFAGLALAHDLTPMVIAMQLWIPCSALFAALWLKERIGWRRGAGIAFAFAGVAALAFDDSVLRQIGPLAMVGLAAALYGAAAVLVRRAGTIHPLTFQAWIAAATWPTLFPASLALEPDGFARAAAAPWTVWAAIAFGALFSSVVANALLFRMVQKYEVSRTTPFLFLSPVVAIGLGVVILHDPITPQIVLGAGLTIAGVALAALAERRFAR